MSELIYLDYAAATPVDADVLAAMQPYFSEKFYNPSATYLQAKAVRKDVEAARHKVAQTLGVRPSEIVFTAGGTEANNLAIHGIMSKHPDAEVVVTAVEHDSVLKSAAEHSHSIAPVLPNGRLNLRALQKTITDATLLVSVMLVNNEIGTLLQVSDVAEIIANVREKRAARGITRPIYLHTDAAQAPLYFNVQPVKLGVDLMTLNGGKIYGPKQSGMLYVKTGVQLSPRIVGGGQELGRRSGTENVASIIGFSVALEKAAARYQQAHRAMYELQRYFLQGFGENIPTAVVDGDRKHSTPNNVHMTFPGVDNERLMMELDEAGIICAEGSACSASSDEPSHVLKAIGLSDETARSTLRFTMGRSTTKAHIDYVIATLQKLLANY